MDQVASHIENLLMHLKKHLFDKFLNESSTFQKET